MCWHVTGLACDAAWCVAVRLCAVGQVLTRLLGAMKDKVNSRVVSDYQAFVLQKTGTRL